MKLLENPIIIFDGAMGTSIQNIKVPDSAWEGNEGCNELLNITAPDIITDIHKTFYDAGAIIVESNTFGANRIVLAEYGLEDKVDAINKAGIQAAQKAAAGRPNTFVAGSVGPGTKLPSLGHIDYDTLSASYKEQITSLIEAGANALIMETCQDLLQVKTVLIAAYEVMGQLKCEVPVFLSVTVETTGTLLAGSDIAAVAATVSPFPIASLGLNCATGPEAMQSHIRYLGENWDRRISCIPNAGLPVIEGGQTVYPLGPGNFSQSLASFVTEQGVSVVGGCCGTTPQHIKALSIILKKATPLKREVTPQPRSSSMYQAMDMRTPTPPLLIGERANTNGSKKFKELLSAEDFDGCLNVALDQEKKGALILDLCTAFAGRDELSDLTKMTRLFAEKVRASMVLDSTTPDCIEQCLKLYPGRLVVNSVNLEDGGAYLDRVASLVKKFGCAVIALAIHEKGQAMGENEKVDTIRRIYDQCVNKHGLKPGDLIFDPLTFPIGTGSEDLKDAGIQTINAIRRIKAEMPGVFTVIGLSNVSFGLSPVSRKVLNSVFLYECTKAGLDMAIVDIARIIPYAKIPEEDRTACLSLIYNREPERDEGPLMRFIAHFKDTADSKEKDKKELEAAPPEKRLAGKLIGGDKEGLEDVLTILLNKYKPVSIINDILIPAMKVVGDLFGKGEMLLPFVLQSAEVMKLSVGFLEPFMEKKDNGVDNSPKVLLATVQGDVHDIGKNLVEIILSNNGYRVFNIGIKVPAETIIQKAREHQVDIIGLSGLLVKSAIVMQQSMPQYKSAGLNVPILLGGAALTKKFVAQSCVPAYDQPVVYCADAFAGLRACSQFEEGKLASTTWEASIATRSAVAAKKNVEILRDNVLPQVPFIGLKHVVDIDIQKVFPYVNDQALFRGRWGYRRAKLSADEYNALLNDKVKPLYENLKKRSLTEGLLQPKAAYGYFKCYSKGDSVIVEDAGNQYEFAFPRQAMSPHFCISDFYHSKEEGGDIAGFMVVTVGDRISVEIKKLYENNEYHDYLMLHGFSVEVTDALAEYWHEVMRMEMGINGDRPDTLTGFVTQEYQGSRYGFGYPACPDLEAHINVFKLIKPELIGVTLTENMEMVPEQTTSAIVAHHPQAKYFAV